MSPDKLAGVHPRLVDAVDRIRLAMHQLGFQMIVTDGVRTDAEQWVLWQQGRETLGPDVAPSRPLGRTVTNADGVKTRSNHQRHVDGWGHAVDMTFLVDGKASWADTLPWRLYAEAAKSQGLKAGADWSMPDRPHIELP